MRIGQHEFPNNAQRLSTLQIALLDLLLSKARDPGFTPLSYQNALILAVPNSYHGLYSTKSTLQVIRATPSEASKHRHTAPFAFHEESSFAAEPWALR